METKTTGTQFFLKEYRKIIDCYINSIALLNSSREVSLCFTSLQRSFHWLGKSLEHTGSESPYAQSENPGNTTIEKTAEHLDGNHIDFEGLDTQTQRVKLLRQSMQAGIDTLKTFLKDVTPNTDLDQCLQESKMSLMDAKMWLGWELARIRNIKEGANIPGPKTEIPL